MSEMRGIPNDDKLKIFQKTPYTCRTDFWSLGILSYELLVGKIPWKNSSRVDLMIEIAQATNVVDSNKEYTQKLSETCRDYLIALCQPEEANRLHHNDPRLFEHPWFHDVNVEIVQKGQHKPLYVPDPAELHFNPLLELEKVLNQTAGSSAQSKDAKNFTEEEQRKFRRFEYFNYRMAEKYKAGDALLKANAAPVASFNSSDSGRIEMTSEIGRASSGIITVDHSSPTGTLSNRSSPMTKGPGSQLLVNSSTVNSRSPQRRTFIGSTDNNLDERPE